MSNLVQRICYAVEMIETLSFDYRRMIFCQTKGQKRKRTGKATQPASCEMQAVVRGQKRSSAKPC